MPNANDWPEPTLQETDDGTTRGHLRLVETTVRPSCRLTQVPPALVQTPPRAHGAARDIARAENRPASTEALDAYAEPSAIGGG